MVMRANFSRFRAIDPQRSEMIILSHHSPYCRVTVQNSISSIPYLSLGTLYKYYVFFFFYTNWLTTRSYTRRMKRYVQNESGYWRFLARYRSSSRLEKKSTAWWWSETRRTNRASARWSSCKRCDNRVSDTWRIASPCLDDLSWAPVSVCAFDNNNNNNILFDPLTLRTYWYNGEIFSKIQIPRSLIIFNTFVTKRTL